MASRQVLSACLWFAVVAVTAAQDTPRPDPQQPTFRTTIQRGFAAVFLQYKVVNLGILGTLILLGALVWASR